MKTGWLVALAAASIALWQIAEHASMPSGPAMTSSSKALSRILEVIGPQVSSVISSGAMPVEGTRPQVGFNPTMPQ